MRKTKNKIAILLFSVMLVLGACAAALLHPDFHRAQVSSAAEETPEYTVLDVGDNIEATYLYSRINDTECDVRITNKDVATKAIIPATAEIDGKQYTVTAVFMNGFMSCPKLVRVSLPPTIKKIGNTAFGNCTELTTINLSNVEEIGNSAFMRCTKLKNIVIPASVTTVGTRILRLSDTKVHVRASSAGANWASNWNEGNGNQDVEYSSTYVEPLLLEPVYDSEVAATYYFVRISDTECDVSIANKSVATRADIPATAIINGKEYKVTKIASNGFMSCPKLKIVTLPESIKKIGNTAFGNCQNLMTIDLANVEEIGSSAFMRCPKLNTLAIPESVTTIGKRILRLGNTQVKAEASVAGENWASNWNEGNGNQSVEFNAAYVAEEPTDEPPQLLGYSLAARQPRIDDFYETEDINIFVPKEYNDGNPILEIPESAFSFANFDQLVVEYSVTPIAIGSYAFEFTTGSNIVINRPIDFEASSESIFLESEVLSVVLPDSLSKLTDSMFSGCRNLQNIYFITPQDMAREASLGIVAQAKTDLENALKTKDDDIIDVTGIVYLPQNSAFARIESNAFSGTTAITELHIPDTVKTVRKQILFGWNSETQTVYVHNESPIYFKDEENPTLGWSTSWNLGFTNVVYDNEYYKITFDYNDGEGSIEAKNVRYNGAVGELPVATHSTYTFGGWFTEEGQQITAETVYTTKGNIMLHARWMERIVLDPQGGSGGSTEVYAYDQQAMPDEGLIAPTKYDRTFVGYFAEPNGVGIKYYEGDGEGGLHAFQDIPWNFDNESKILYAHWVPTVYHITYALAPIGALVPPAPVTSVDNPTDVTSAEYHVLREPSARGYRFEGWYNEDGEKVTELRDVHSSMTLQATWEGTVYNVRSVKETLTASARYSIVYLQVSGTKLSYTVQVASTVQQLYVVSSSGLSVEMQIIAFSRNSELRVLLQSLIIKAPDGCSAMHMMSDQTLHLFMYGGSMSGGNGYAGVPNGMHAVSAKNVEIHTPVNLIGGNGYYNTGNGGHGVYLKAGGKLIISSDNVTLYGGNGYSSLPGIPGVSTIKGGYGYGVYAPNKEYTIVYGSPYYRNVIIMNGKGL